MNAGSRPAIGSTSPERCIFDSAAVFIGRGCPIERGRWKVWELPLRTPLGLRWGGDEER